MTLAAVARRRLLAICGVFGAMLAMTTPATAQDPKVDRNSPAGVEYQLPIERAREQAGGGGGVGAQSGAAPLFGAGAEKVQRRGVGGSAHSAARGSARGTKASGTLKQPALDAETPHALRTQAASPHGGSSGLLPIGAAGAGVLLAGGLVGLGWRRRAVGR